MMGCGVTIFAFSNKSQLERLCSGLSEATSASLSGVRNSVGHSCANGSYDELVSVINGGESVFFNAFDLIYKIVTDDDPLFGDRGLDDDILIDKAFVVVESICSDEDTYKSVYRINFQMTFLPSGASDFCDKYEKVSCDPYCLKDILPLHDYLQKLGLLDDDDYQIEHLVSHFENESTWGYGAAIDEQYGFVFPISETVSSDLNVIAECGTLYVKSKSSRIEIGEVDTESEFYVVDDECRRLFCLNIISVDGFDFSGVDNDIRRYRKNGDDLSGDLAELDDALPISFDESLAHIASKGMIIYLPMCSDSSIFMTCNSDDYCGVAAVGWIDHEKKKVVVKTRSYVEFAEHYDYYECQSLVGLPAAIHDAYRDTGNYGDYKHELIGYDSYSVCVSENLAIVVKGNIEAVIGEIDGLNFEDVTDLYSQINTVDGFIDAMVEYGVASVSGNEVLAHDNGDMAGNVFVGYATGKEKIVFTVLSPYGYGEDYIALKETFCRRFGKNFRIAGVLEDNWGTASVMEIVGNQYDTNCVLELPSKPELFRLPFLVLRLGLSNPFKYMSHINSLSNVDQSLLNLMIPQNSPISTSKMCLLPPVIISEDDYVETLREIIDENEISYLGDAEEVAKITKSLRSSCNKDFAANRRGMFAFVVLCDANNSDLMELALRNMYGLLPKMNISNDNLDAIGERLGVEKGELKYIAFSSSLPRS